jgi:DNA primase
LFDDDVARRAFLAWADGKRTLVDALDRADPDAREYLERASVTDIDDDSDWFVEVKSLIAAAVRRALARRRASDDPATLEWLSRTRVFLHDLDDPATAEFAAESLLGWLQDQSEGEA